MRPEHLQKAAERWFNYLEYLTVRIFIYLLAVKGFIDVVRSHVK